MPKKVPYLREEQIERDAAVLLAEYAQARNIVIAPPIPIEDIVEKHLKLGIELMELIAKSVSRVRMHVFNRSGHFPYAEYPAEVARLLVDFVAPQQ